MFKVVLMKKLLLFASNIALTFSLILHAAHAMEKEDLDIEMEVETAKATPKRKADILEDNSAMVFEIQNQNNIREANIIEDNSGTKKIKTEDTRITFPLQNLFPKVKNLFLPTELIVKIIQALKSKKRKAYAQVNHQCKDFIDFCTTSISLKIDLNKFKFDAYYEYERGDIAPMASFGFLLKYPHLESLKISHDLVVDHWYFQSLTHLKRLDLEGNKFIKDGAISVLTNLEELNLAENQIISNNSITSFTKLKALNLSGNSSITDDAVSMLTNLEELNLDMNETIRNDGIRFLTQLKTLNLCENPNITDGTLALFTNLTNLDLGYNEQITNAGLSNLTNLEKLDIIAADLITSSSIEHLTKLRSLRFDFHKVNIVSLITNCPFLNILDCEENRMEGQKATQDLIALIEHLFSTAEKNRDNIDATEFSALKKVYAVKFLHYILNPQTEEEYESLYPTNTIFYSVEDMNKIINEREKHKIEHRDENEYIIPQYTGELLREDGLDLINSLFALNKMNIKLVSH
jgi:hypothetical protein